MLIDPLFALFCNQIGTLTPGSAQVPCQNAVTAISQITNTTLTFQELESYGQNYVYKNIDPTLIKTLIAIGFLENSWQQKSVIAQIPLKPFEFNCNVQANNVNYGIKFKWEF